MLSIVLLVILCLLLTRRIFANNISNIDDFQELMQGYGAIGPIVLTFIQAFQVVIPVLPGYLGCAVGAISYGTITGFICNYVGISGDYLRWK